MNPETIIQNNIILALASDGHKIFRANAGKIKNDKGMWIKLFPKGFPDLCGWHKETGQFIAIEVKTQTGRLSEEQKRFAKFAETQPILYGVARSVDDALEILQKG